MINLGKRYFSEIKRILLRHVPECEAVVFGSRAGTSKKARRYSDIDIALKGPKKLPLRRLEALRDAFSVSDLPVIVDILDLRSVSPNFRRIIESDFKVIRKPKNGSFFAGTRSSRREVRKTP